MGGGGDFETNSQKGVLIFFIVFEKCIHFFLSEHYSIDLKNSHKIQALP